MRAIRHVPVVLVALGMVACTSLLGDYSVGTGAGTSGGLGEAGTEGGPLVDAATDSLVTSDSPSDARLDAPPTCTAPMVACGSACVNLDNDGKNCGMCDRDCLGGTCTARVCGSFSLVSRGDILDRTLAASDTDLFFGTVMTSEVIQQPVTLGSAPISLGMLGEIYAIAPAPPNVFFTYAAASLWQVGRAGVGVAGSGVANNPTMGGKPVGLVVAGQNLHLLHVTSTPTSPSAFEITACPTNGAACFGNFNGPGVPGAKLAAGNGYVFWTESFNGSVFAYPDAVGLKVTVSNSEPGANYPAWDGTTLFWDATSTMRLRKSAYPMPSATDFRDVGSSANDLLVDGSNVYWSIYNGTDNDLFAIPKGAASGTMPTRLAHGEIRHLAQTPSGIYWANAAGISGVRKP